MGSSFSGLLELPRRTDRAMGTEWSCPICHDEQEGVSYVIPCGHKFCMGCILRWAEKKPECPLCRRLIESVRFSLQEQKYLECVITLPEESPEGSSQAEGALGLLDGNSCHRPAGSPPSSPQWTLSPAEQGAAGTGAVVGLLPKVWAQLFQKKEHLLDPVLPWLRQRLEAIFGSRWWLAVRAEKSILYTLCLWGPDEEVMFQMLQPLLEQCTKQLVDGIISIIVGQCSEEAQRLLHSHAAGEEDNSPEASSCSTSSQGGTSTWPPSPASSPAGSDMEDQPSTTEAALCALRIIHPSVPIPTEQVQPQKEQGEAVVASSSSHKSSCNPATPCQGWEHSLRGPQHLPEGRASRPQHSSWSTDRPTETEWSCPICHDGHEDAAYAMPCGHQFCLGCIMHWTDRKPVCPVCSRTILIVRFSVREEDDYLQCLVTPSRELPEVCSQAGTAPSHMAENSPHGPTPFPPSFPHGTLSPAQQRAGWPEAVGGLLPEVWAELFQGQKHLLDPVLPWLCQRLEAIYGSQWWLAKNAEGCILQVLCLCGLDGKVLFQMLQPVLEGYTAPLVYGLINVIMYRCSTEAQRLLRFHAGRETNSPAASSSSFWGESPASSVAPVSSLAGSDTESQPSTSQATFCRDTGCPLSVSLSAEQVQLQEELGEVEAAGSSAQGSNCRASTSSQGRVCSHGRSQHPRKRRAPAHQDSHSCVRSRSGSSTSRAPASIYSRERK